MKGYKEGEAVHQIYFTLCKSFYKSVGTAASTQLHQRRGMMGSCCCSLPATRSSADIPCYNRGHLTKRTIFLNAFLKLIMSSAEVSYILGKTIVFLVDEGFLKLICLSFFLSDLPGKDNHVSCGGGFLVALSLSLSLCLSSVCLSLSLSVSLSLPSSPSCN